MGGYALAHPAGELLIWHYLSSRAMTVMVEVDETERIVRTPPIVRTFIGQPVENLIHWMKKQGGLIGNRTGG